MIYFVVFLSVWWSLGYVGYVIVRYWWTADFDWTTAEHRLALFQAVAFGPFLILIGLVLLLFTLRTEEKILKPKRVK